MDFNHRLIEAVRQCPLLYKNNASLSDRKCGWQQIAEQMKMQEALLKSRWHFLREHYKRNAVTDSQVASNQFPYKKEMEFLLPYLQPPRRVEPPVEDYLPVNIIKPEFVITEKDLENDSGNEEYVFLDVETLGSEDEANNEATPQLNDNELRKELEEDEHEQEQQHDQDHDQDQQHQDTYVHKIERIEVEMQIKQEETEDQQPYDENQREPKPLKKEIQEALCNRNGETEDEAVRIQIQEATEENVEGIVEKREVDSSNANRNNNPEERCEDAIFGELVSAMLRKMPAEKKRTVKRDIMNLLLT